MNLENYRLIHDELKPTGATLVAVSKTKPLADILTLYNAGQHAFGENKVQELLPKHEALPKDIQWHFIGHLQTNKVKLIAPFIAMVQSVDSLKLLQEIDKQAARNNRTINCLLQVFIASEETKFGLSEQELLELLAGDEFKTLRNIRICGLMGMASNTEDEEQVRREFEHLHSLFAQVKERYFAGEAYFKELSMGMSPDYRIALQCGATIVRLGSILFGARS